MIYLKFIGGVVFTWIALNVVSFILALLFSNLITGSIVFIGSVLGLVYLLIKLTTQE